MTRGDTADPWCTTLARELGRPVSFAEAADAVIRAASEWPGEWHELRTPSDALRSAAEAHAAQFRSPAWTWRR